MLTLRLSEWPAGDGTRRVEAALEDGGIRQTAVSRFEFELTALDRERLRWYLEDFLEYPQDPAPKIAADVEQRLAELGTELFDKVFADRDGQDLWATVRGRLADTRVEISADVRDGVALPWELLRDPRTHVPVALRASSFVHVHHRPAQPMRLPESTGAGLRVLLVVCRPAGPADVPFRSVASQLVRLSELDRRSLTLDVLRPPTFVRLSEVLHDAARRGQPYHVVHFDGHGTYTDLAGQPAAEAEISLWRFGLLSPVRPGAHGYLLFEDPTAQERMQLVDGPAIGALLAQTNVPVLVLNACRSAYADPTADPDEAEPDGTTDVHARIRAYGSLAQEVADAGVPGVVSMRYNIYVVTAAQFVADLYRALLGGQALGAAVGQGRRQLAAQPNRRIAFEPRPLQDWPVPVVHEAAPLSLFTPADRHRIRLDGEAPDAGDGSLPPRPDVGFFGRDETLLALDRALDDHAVVLLHAFAGAGKTTTAAEFARWYQLTDPSLRDKGFVLFTSFEQHTPLPRLLNQLGDTFGPAIAAAGIEWFTLSHEQRRGIALQLLSQVPVLWIWDNVETVAGFPAGTRSDWSGPEQAELRDFLRAVTQTPAKVVLTSRRDEHDWLGALPARVELPGMPMRERIQLTQALAPRHGHQIDDVDDWRPLLRYTAGNPLTITVLVGQALRARLTTRRQIEELVARLRGGEADIDDADEGRSASLAASLSYGFAHAFTGAERAQLAVLHVFRGTVDVGSLTFMGDPNNEGCVPQLAGLTDEAAIRLLDRAAEVGLLTPVGSRFYRIHPALPWYFGQLFTETYRGTEAYNVIRAYVRTMCDLGDYCHLQFQEGDASLVSVLAAAEDNLLHAVALGRRHGWWRLVMGCMQGIRTLYRLNGRNAEWAGLVGDLAADLIDSTGRPRAGREESWRMFTEYRAQLAMDAHDWTTAEDLQRILVAWQRQQDPDDAENIRQLAISLQWYGDTLREQQRSECVALYMEAIALSRRLQDIPDEATLAHRLEASVTHHMGNAYMDIPDLRDLEKAERWYQRSMDLYKSLDGDMIGMARIMCQLGNVYYERAHEVARAGAPEKIQAEWLKMSLALYNATLDLFPEDAAGDRAIVHNQLGLINYHASRIETSFDHFRQAIRYAEATGNHHHAGSARLSMAAQFEYEGHLTEARHYAEAALLDFQRVPNGAERIAVIEEFLADLDRKTRRR
jgi:tetratricopeptide (TPR) repeat protein